jgi:endonuclease YncB( thermonuclease family)
MTDQPALLELAAAVGASNAYAGVVASVRDGDSVHVTVMDPLLSASVVLAVRILGINTNELGEPGGPEAKAALQVLLPPGETVTLRRVRPDKYSGRTVASVTTSAGVDVAAWLIERQLAVAWSGVGPKPRVTWPPAPAGKERHG